MISFTGSPKNRFARTPNTSTAPTPTFRSQSFGGLGELGGFGLSVPEEFGGFSSGGEDEYVGMVIATEELSWGSLCIGGSLITRPEIMTRALPQWRHARAKRAVASPSRQCRNLVRYFGNRA